MRRALCAEMRSGNGVYFRENLSVLPIEILNCYIPIPSDLLGGTFWAYLNIGGDLYPPMYMAATPMHCSEIRGRMAPTHRIAFNSLYLFSSKSITYEANGGVLYHYTRGEPISLLSLRKPPSSTSFSPPLRSKTSGRRGLHDA